MMPRPLTILLAAVWLSSCTEEVLPLAIPDLQGPLTEGQWDPRQRRGISFWPPTTQVTRFPEMIDFSCIDGRSGEVRITLTGDTARTSLWFAEDTKSSRNAIFATEAGAVELAFNAGELLLPSALVRTDESWLQPLLREGGTFAINAYGQRTYRLKVTEELARTLGRCGTVS